MNMDCTLWRWCRSSFPILSLSLGGNLRRTPSFGGLWMVKTISAGRLSSWTTWRQNIHSDNKTNDASNEMINMLGSKVGDKKQKRWFSYLKMFLVYRNILLLCHHHQVIPFDGWRSVMTLQVNFYCHSYIQVYLPHPSLQSPFCHPFPCSRRHLKTIWQFQASAVMIRQPSRHQVTLGENWDGVRFDDGLLLSVVEAEDSTLGGNEHLKGHLLGVSNVKVAADAEVGRSQSCDPPSLEHEACVVLHLQVGILSHHLHQSLGGKEANHNSSAPIQNTRTFCLRNSIKDPLLKGIKKRKIRNFSNLLCIIFQIKTWICHNFTIMVLLKTLFFNTKSHRPTHLFTFGIFKVNKKNPAKYKMITKIFLLWRWPDIFRQHT